MPGGRPSSFTEDLAEEFCRRLTTGRSVLSVCSDEDMPSHDTIYKWVKRHPGFADDLARAREERAEAYAGEIQDIGRRTMTDPTIDPQRARVAVDAIDKAARLVQPKRVELTGAKGGAVQVETKSDLDAARAIAFLLAKGAAQS